MGDCKQLLSFVVNDAMYAVDILRVSEIRRWEGAAHVPNAPKAIRGVVNVRGVIVPVIELRCVLGCEEHEYGKTSVVFLVRAEVAGEERTVGMLADGVSDVCDIPVDELRAPSIEACSDGGEVVDSLTYIDGTSVVVLDIDEVVSRITGGGVLTQEESAA